MNSLIMFSGGIDSALSAYKELTQTNNAVQLHHIRMINKENRHTAEDIAVRNLFDALQRIRPCRLTKSTWDACKESRFMSADMRIVAFTAAQVCVNDRSIQRAIVGTNLSDVLRGQDVIQRGAIAEQIFDIAKLDSKAIWTRNIFELNDEQIKEELPEELYNLTHSCRTPRRDHSPCHRCKTCKQKNL